MKNIIFAIILAWAPQLYAQSVSAACQQVGLACAYEERYALLDRIYSASCQVMFPSEHDGQMRSCSRGPRDEAFCKDLLELALPDDFHAANSRTLMHLYDVHCGMPREYSGTALQNAKLARNILANRQLFKHGRLSLERAARWRLVP